MPKLYDINDVEIFQSGKYPQGIYGEKELQQLIDSFDEIGGEVKPFLKFGHTQNQILAQSDGLPALGWISKLKMKGEKILANFKNVPEKVYNLIAHGAYRRVSAEISPDYNFGGKIYPKVLKAIALLGGDTPQIKTLDDIIALGFKEDEVLWKEDEPTAFEAVEIKIQEDVMDEKAFKVLQDQSERQVKEFKEKEIQFKETEKTFQGESKAKDEEINKLKAENEKHFSELAKIKQEKEETEINTLVDKFIAEEHVLPAEKDKVIKMLKATKSDDEKKDLIEFIESQKVDINTKTSSKGSKPESDKFADDDDALVKKIEKYMEDNKGVTYNQAYRIVTSKLSEKNEK